MLRAAACCRDLRAVAVVALREGGAAFGRVLETAGFWPALGGSAALTLVAATLSTTVGLAVALHLSRLSAQRRTALSFVIALPLTFSGLIVAYGFILGYGRAGFVTQLLARAGLDAATIGGALFTPIGLAFASSYYLIPRVVMRHASGAGQLRPRPARRRRIAGSDIAAGISPGAAAAGRRDR